MMQTDTISKIHGLNQIGSFEMGKHFCVFLHASRTSSNVGENTLISDFMKMLKIN